jgi:hypothetical protein
VRGRARDLGVGRDAALAVDRITELVGQSFWDPLAAAALVDPGLVDTRTARVVVDPVAGARQEDGAGRAVRLALAADGSVRASS